MWKKWLDFGDIDLIYKVTLALCQSLTLKKLVCILSVEPNDGCWPNFMYCIIVIIKKKKKDFGDLDLIFKVTTIKTVKMSIVCTLSPEPIDGFSPNLQRNTTETWEKMVRF